MTLAIALNCSEGIVIIADKKVTTSMGFTYEDKISLLPGSACAFVSSGFKDLFRQFNRKIGILVDQRKREYKIKNEVELRKIGMSISQFEIKKESPETINGKEDITRTREISEENLDTNIELPFIYTGEHFITDCKELIESIGTEGKKFSQNPIDLIVALNTGVPTIFHMDCDGFERQIDKYIAIGSGSHYVKKFFDRLWKNNMSIEESILLGIFVIKYIEHLKIDPHVGCGEKDVLPQIIVFLKDGRYGNYDIKDEKNILDHHKKITDQFDKIIRDLKLGKIVPIDPSSPQSDSPKE